MYDVIECVAMLHQLRISFNSGVFDLQLFFL